MAIDRRLNRLRALVDRLERLPASERREWMLREARARMADVETGDEPRALRALADEPPHAARESTPRPRARRPVKPPSPERPPAPDPAPAPISWTEPSPATLASDELLWLGDPAGDGLAEPGDDTAKTAPWRRGLRD